MQGCHAPTQHAYKRTNTYTYTKRWRLHVPQATCGVCPALALALRASMDLTAAQLRVTRARGPPACADEHEVVCAAMVADTDSGSACEASPPAVLGACKVRRGAVRYRAGRWGAGMWDGKPKQRGVWSAGAVLPYMTFLAFWRSRLATGHV